jgi:site-specific DNA-methyltransferase (adenine-specific)
LTDSGSAARFFYCAKASKAEREAGCEGLPIASRKTHGDTGPSSNANPNGQKAVRCRNHHPCVKPLALMRYLCRLVTPPGGLILDPFMGSGSTGIAAVLEGFRFAGIELKGEYVTIAKRRIAAARK